MNGIKPECREEISDLAKLRIHEYFDHYLTNVFPKQAKALFASHDADVRAHQDVLLVHEKTCRTGTTIKRWKWMIAGAFSLIGIIGTIGVEQLLRVLKVL